jgi:hypothetical protein
MHLNMAAKHKMPRQCVADPDGCRAVRLIEGKMGGYSEGADLNNRLQI